MVLVLVGCASPPKAEAYPAQGKSLDTSIQETGTIKDIDQNITVAAVVKVLSLDEAIQEAAAQMDMRLPATTKVALVSVGSSSAQLSEYIINRLEAALVGSRKLVVVDRANLDKVRVEQGFQLSGDVSDASAKAIGQLLGAGAIVTGSFTDLGDVYGLTLKAINMETAAVAVSYPADIAKSSRITTLLAAGGGVAGSDVGYVPVAEPAAGGNAAAALTATKVYKVGDTGPAGGIVFYDKGNKNGGWRYLETAPTDIAQKPRMYAGFREQGTVSDRHLGSGKRNTQEMLSLPQISGGWLNTSPWLCDQLEINGYDDWYLPAIDELTMIYTYLYTKNFGAIKRIKYISSTHFNNGPTICLDFSNGKEDYIYTNEDFRVRAIRQF